MLKFVEKFISFDHEGHSYMKSKVDKCKSLDDLKTLFKEERWITTEEILFKIYLETPEGQKEKKALEAKAAETLAAEIAAENAKADEAAYAVALREARMKAKAEAEVAAENSK